MRPPPSVENPVLRAGRPGRTPRGLADAVRRARRALCIQLRAHDPGRAEVAVEVADDLHGLGLGTILIERLAEIAERHGVVTFVAEVLPENEAMLDVFRDGFDAEVSWCEGIERVQFPTSAWRLARERYAV
ncbi:MAG: GNAT family N-acetyltransferase [Solirubrobacterales bacterium]